MKRSMIFMISLILVLGSLVAAAGAARAAGEPDMTRHMRYGLRMAEKNLFPGRMLLKMKDEIGITEDQAAKIEKMEAAHDELCIKRNADIKVLYLHLDTFLKEEKINRAELAKKLKEIAALRTEMQIDNINHLLDLRELLSAEQLAKIDELKKERRHRMMDRKDRSEHREARKDRREERRENRNQF